MADDQRPPRPGPAHWNRWQQMFPGYSRDFWIGIPYFRQIGGSRAGVELAEHGKIQRMRSQFRDAAFRIVEVAEDDRVGGTNLLAGGFQFTVTDRPVLFLGIDP